MQLGSRVAVSCFRHSEQCSVIIFSSSSTKFSSSGELEAEHLATLVISDRYKKLDRKSQKIMTLVLAHTTHIPLFFSGLFWESKKICCSEISQELIKIPLQCCLPSTKLTPNSHVLFFRFIFPTAHVT